MTDLAYTHTTTQSTKGFDGLSGEVAARMMARLNADMELAAVQLLEPGIDERYLIVGSGPGVGIMALLNEVLPRDVVAIDPSPTMLRVSRRRVAAHPYADKVQFAQVYAADIPASAGLFQGVVAVNSQQLWQPHLASAQAVASVLAPGGRLVSLTHTWAITKRCSVEEWRGIVSADLDDAGFDDLQWSNGSYRTGEAVVLVARRAAI